MQIPIPRILLALAFLTSCLTLASSSQSHAGMIDYTDTESPVTIYGPNGDGLSGATLTVTFQVSDTAVYTSVDGVAAVAVSNAFVTISGDTQVPSNNGTYALPINYFIPTATPDFPNSAGFFDYSSGGDQFASIILNSGSSLSVVGATNATAHGSIAAVGDQVNILDFGPTTNNTTYANFDSGDSTQYSQDGVVSAVDQSSTAPEPATIVSTSLGVLMLAGLARTRVRSQRR